MTTTGTARNGPTLRPHALSRVGSLLRHDVVHRLWIAVLAYGPLLLFGDRRINADTKLYLSSNPGDLMERAAHAWDSSQFGGFVPHQAVGYLWPMGPWYWSADRLGLPDWLAQRLWLGTIFLAAALGVRRFILHLGFSRGAALLGALAYMFSPYVLPYASRTSAMLLPWAGLGWLCYLTARGTMSSSWRWPASVALVLLTVGQVNGAATLYMLAGPALVALDVATRGATRSSLLFGAKAALLGAGTSVWWIAAVGLQARHGADVLAYSETVEAVSSTSNAFEVIRGFGYWLNYVGIDSVPLTTAARDALASTPAIFASLVVPCAAVTALAITRRDEARLGSWLVLAGIVLAVGAHPVNAPSPWVDAILSRPDSSLSLALRSSTRAMPVMLVGFSLGLAALYDSTRWTRVMAGLRRRVPSLAGRWPAPVTALALVVSLLAAAPGRVLQGSVDPHLSFEKIPDSWRSAVATIETETDEESRILQVPGQEFGAYTWGYTTDPALPAVTSRPVLTRDLLPLGEARMMDSLFALDDAVREGRLDTAALIALGGTLSFGSVFFPGDTDPTRFATPSADDIITANALADTLVDLGGGHRALLLPRGLGTTVRQQEATVVVAGDGKGLVDVAAAGLLGGGTVRYASDIADSSLSADIARSRGVIVTDTGALVARHWRGSRDALGFSEDTSGRTGLLVRDRADVRLPVFSPDRAADRTSFEQRGPVLARATTYGSPIAYHPEHRPFRAVDGNLDTAWLAGEDADPTGAILELTAQSAVSSVRLVQPEGTRRIAEVSMSLDGGPWRARTLFTSDVTLDLAFPASRIALRIERVEGNPANGNGVGFAEVDLGLGPVREVGVLPTRWAEGTGEDTPLAYVMTRLRAPVHDPSRADPESSFVRSFFVPSTRTLVLRTEITAEEPTPSVLSVSIDGSSIPLRRDSASGAWTSEPFTLTTGDHELDTTPSGALIDRIIITDTAWSSTPFAPTPASVEGSSVHRTAELTACPRGCWLVLAEGFNSGWQAEFDGLDLGDPVPVDGGSNGWWLEPGTPAGTATFEFSPQRSLSTALGLTVAGVFLAFLVLAASRRRHEEDVPTLPSPRGIRSRVVLAVIAGMLTAACVSPKYGVLAAVLCALASMMPVRLRLLVPPFILASALSWGALLVVRQAGPPSFAWPQAADPANRLVLMAIVLLVVTRLGSNRVAAASSSTHVGTD